MHSVLASCHLASICRMLHSNGSSSPDKARDVDNHLILRTAYATKQGNQATLGRMATPAPPQGWDACFRHYHYMPRGPDQTPQMSPTSPRPATDRNRMYLQCVPWEEVYLQRC
ncbi:hypothetical protein CGMCC3_g9768 [Colletotrichum fructicola]|nr:uncharacterized protein CGMCC3_g9768 [Colletotrichum fructicola]KAE9574131.1 hypothetical protein CGMCC3_g9768 [Colletotrichum fructicola]